MDSIATRLFDSGPAEFHLTRVKPFASKSSRIKRCSVDPSFLMWVAFSTGPLYRVSDYLHEGPILGPKIRTVEESSRLERSN